MSFCLSLSHPSKLICNSSNQLICPRWVYQQFKDPTKVPVYIFETPIKINIYAIPSRWINDAQHIDRWYFNWYDYNGKLLFETLNDKRIIYKMNLKYLGKCKPVPQFCRPFWLSQVLPDYKGRIDLYWHLIYGNVYTIDRGIADHPKTWYSSIGKELHVSPTFGIFPKEMYDKDKKWLESVIYIGMCEFY